METHSIDASGKVLGRLATEIVLLLRGKNRPDFAPNRLPALKVVVTNADQVRVTGKKFIQKLYFRHSGYPGGSRFTRLRDAFERDPSWVLRQAVSGMLPKNRLRAQLLKRLTIYHHEPTSNSNP